MNRCSLVKRISILLVSQVIWVLQKLLDLFSACQSSVGILVPIPITVQSIDQQTEVSLEHNDYPA